MGYRLNREEMNNVLRFLAKNHRIYAPVRFSGQGRFSDTDSIRYAEIQLIEDVVFEERSQFSAKEVILPLKQTLFYFTEDQWKEPEIDPRGILLFLRSCDIHAVARLDEMMLNNGPYPDYYYEKLRSKVRFVLIECEQSFEQCFCVSMGTSQTDRYGFSIRRENQNYVCDVKKDYTEVFSQFGESVSTKPHFVEANPIQIKLPVNLEGSQIDPLFWQEYSSRCQACGQCNVVCPTCGCFTVQDLFYEDNLKCGERRRVWASCQIDGFTDLAGGQSYRGDRGERMRYKVFHKIVDHKKRFGTEMCVGCGRCDASCPEYISFAQCVNKLCDWIQEAK